MRQVVSAKANHATPSTPSTQTRAEGGESCILRELAQVRRPELVLSIDADGDGVPDSIEGGGLACAHGPEVPGSNRLDLHVTRSRIELAQQRGFSDRIHFRCVPRMISDLGLRLEDLETERV
jgi:hypothetical protein